MQINFSAALFLLLSASPSFAATKLLNGAGATFPYPLYSQWFSDYRKVDPAVEINYQSIGSGGGVRQFLDQTVDFGASDAPMTDEQLGKATQPVLHIPTVLGAVAVVSSHTGLKLTPALLSEIYLGKIKNWTDPKLVALNPALAKATPPAILVVHRSDGSGTTAVFSDYLSKVSPEWKSTVGTGTALKWPTGLGGKGNEGVTALVKQTPGSIGYIELAYAEKNGLQTASLKNKSGQFIAPTTQSITEAGAAMVGNTPADFRVSITDAEGAKSYPIASYTYLLVYKNKSEKTGILKSFLSWAVSEGQKLAAPLGYAPLPKSIAEKVKKKLNTEL